MLVFFKRKYWISLALMFLPIALLQAQDSLLEEIFNSTQLGDNEKYDSIYYHYFFDKSPSFQIRIADELVTLAIKDQDYLWLYRAHFLKANAYLYLADLERAYTNYLKSLRFAEEGNLTNLIYTVFVELGNVSSLNGDRKNAISNYKTALEYVQKIDDPIYEGYTLLNIVDEYQKTDYFDSILYFLRKADTIFKYNADDVGRAYVYGNYALFQVKKGDITNARINLNLCLQILNEHGSEYDITVFQIEMAKIFHKQKKFESALNYASHSYNRSKAASLNGQTRDASKLLAEIYNELGEHKKAYNYHVEYVNYKDSISNEETIRKMADLRADYEISQKQAEIDTLEKRHSFNRVIISIVATSLLILIILSYRLYINHKLVKKQKSKLQKLDKTKNKMFSIISHDLRGPIHSMTGYSSLMSELIINRETDELMEMCGHMNQSFVNISALLDNLLEWATNQQGQIPHNPELLNIYTVFKSLQETFSNSAKVKGVSINLQIDKSLKLYVDKNTFSTIFRNLIGNAIKFTNKGDSITLSSQITDTCAVLSVADTGIGISKEKLSDLFVLGKTKSTWGTANEKGIGLGLRLVHEFTMLNKGKITVESEEGKGSSFSVKFPLPKTEETES